MKKHIGYLSLWFLGICAAHASAVVLQQPLPPLPLQDQHAKAWSIRADTRLVIFAAGRTPSNLVMEVLGEQPKGFLDSHHAVYVADMSRMPGIITRTFALPALREQPFSVGVALEEKLLSQWPRQEDAITLIHLEAGKVERIDYARSANELKAALGL